MQGRKIQRLRAVSFLFIFYSTRRQHKMNYDCRRLFKQFLDPGSIPGISTKVYLKQKFQYLLIFLFGYKLILSDNFIMKKLNLKISKKAIIKTAEISSKMEGISFAKAKKNSFVIKLLRKHGRAFSI